MFCKSFGFKRYLACKKVIIIMGHRSLIITNERTKIESKKNLVFHKKCMLGTSCIQRKNMKQIAFYNFFFHKSCHRKLRKSIILWVR